MKTNTTANMLFVLGPFIAAGLFLILLSPFLINSIIAGCYVLGLLLLIMAKWPLFRKNVWFSFGPQKLDSSNRKIYFQAYKILSAGVIVNIIALLTLHMRN